MSTSRVVRAPRGNELSCKGWVQEAALRMLCNNLDPDVAERPQDLVVYGGSGKAARNWECFDVILRELRTLGDDETLLVQSGKAVGKFRTHADAPRVLIANSNLVPRWANWTEFRRLEALGLTMFGQMTAGSWIYIGTQGILQGTFETFVAAKKAFEARKGRPATWLLTAGLGGMGGAQPLAASMAGIGSVSIEIDESRIEKRLQTRYVDERIDDIARAVEVAKASTLAGKPRSIAVCGNAAELYPELVERGIIADLVTEQTSAHDPLNGYIPLGLTLETAAELRAEDAEAYVDRAKGSMCAEVEAMLAMKAAGAEVFDYGNNIRQNAKDAGCEDAFEIPGFVPAYIRPQFCEGRGPFRWVALSGDPKDIAVTDEIVLAECPDDKNLRTWITLAQERVEYQGLPARICWFGYGERHRIGLAFNKAVREGRISAPIVIGRDHLDCGSVASPFRETEAMKDGSDAIADWAILNALVNTACGASWVSFHHGGGVGIGNSLHAGMVIVADGTDDAARRLERVLTADPGMGVIRHADAGYDIAIDTAKERGVHVPHRILEVVSAAARGVLRSDVTLESPARFSSPVIRAFGRAKKKSSRDRFPETALGRGRREGMAQQSALEVLTMSIAGVDSNAQLIAWASQHTAAMGKTMQDAMDGGDARQDELSQLAKIQSSLEQAKSESNPNYLNQAKAELEKLFADHPDMKDSLGDLYNQVSTADFNFRTKDGTQDYSSAKTYGDPAGAAAWKEADDTISSSLGSDGAWSTMLSAANDSIKKADDKGMLEIQNLNSEIQQAQQLASGLVSSNNQTSMSVIGNMRA